MHALKKLAAISIVVTTWLFAAVSSGLTRTRATQAQDDKTIKLRSDLVSINASVTDPSGRAIKDLKASDFTVLEDGRPQKISYFAATEAPFAVMLLLDLSGSTAEEIGIIRAAAQSFLGQLNHDDRVGVLAFSGEVYIIAGLDDSLNTVQDALSQIQPVSGTGRYRFNTNTGTAFYDAMYGTMTETALPKLQSRKAIVCVSDGVDSTSRTRFKESQRLIEDSDASVYFLELDTEKQNLAELLRSPNDPDYANFSRSQVNRYFDYFDPASMDRNLDPHMLSREMRTRINHGLYQIAHKEIGLLTDRTGGRVYPVNTFWDLAGVFRQIASDLRTVYSLGYYSNNDTKPGGWRAIKVEAKRRGARVRCRPGYYAPGKN